MRLRQGPWPPRRGRDSSVNRPLGSLAAFAAFIALVLIAPSLVRRARDAAQDGAAGRAALGGAGAGTVVPTAAHRTTADAGSTGGDCRGPGDRHVPTRIERPVRHDARPVSTRGTGKAVRRGSASLGGSIPGRHAAGRTLRVSCRWHWHHLQLHRVRRRPGAEARSLQRQLEDRPGAGRSFHGAGQRPPLDCIATSMSRYFQWSRTNRLRSKPSTQGCHRSVVMRCTCTL